MPKKRKPKKKQEIPCESIPCKSIPVKSIPTKNGADFARRHKKARKTMRHSRKKKVLY